MTKSALRFCGHAMAAFLDFCVGVFFVWVYSYIFLYKPNLEIYILGGALALLPDFDIFYITTIKIWRWVKKIKRKNKFNHRVYITHRPLVIIPLTALVSYYFGGLVWMVISISCVVWHYIHDSEPFSESGIAWIWPFCDKFYTFKRIVHSEIARQEGDEKYGEHGWIDNLWLQPSLVSKIELGIGTILLMFVFMDNFGLSIISVSSILPATVFGIVWKINSQIS